MKTFLSSAYLTLDNQKQSKETFNLYYEGSTVRDNWKVLNTYLLEGREGGKYILLLKYMIEWHFQCYTLARVLSRLR